MSLSEKSTKRLIDSKMKVKGWGIFDRYNGEFSTGIDKNTTNRPLLVFLMFCSNTCTEPYLTSFLSHSPFDCILAHRKGVSRDCRTILRELGTLLAIR